MSTNIAMGIEKTICFMSTLCCYPHKKANDFSDANVFSIAVAWLSLTHDALCFSLKCIDEWELSLVKSPLLEKKKIKETIT